MLRRTDMQDSGESYCEGCAEDALESGVFSDVSEDDEEDMEPSGPEADDYVIRCDGFRYHVGIVDGGGSAFVGTFGEEEDAEEAVREHRASTSPEFFPNVWRESDHGNVSIAEGWTWDAKGAAHGS